MRTMTLILLTIAAALPAAAGEKFSEGRWRLELSGSGGIDSGAVERSGDALVHFEAEYEIPATKHLALGLRLMPALVYFQDSDGDDDFLDFDDDDFSGDGDTVFGAGAGLALRLYTKPETHQGLFFELGTTAFVHSEEFVGNSSNFNFLTDLGVGYQFQNHWHAIFKFEHISNAGFGNENKGVNTVGLGFGYRF